ncbi:Receptor-type tyrosine-protein phosphatase T [Armadillidium vulgare]|nr:Receptor-type tyrosine-protein phosphatase T [Armadillidium vulgare]
MCVQYWPAQVGLTDTYTTVKVELMREEQLANFIIRTFKIYKLGQQQECREVVQFHYTEWASHSNPFSISLLEFRRRIKIWTKNNLSPADGPTIVHCSDGAGRSGVYLAVDANLELNEEDGQFNIYGYLKKMRQARKELIEKLEVQVCLRHFARVLGKRSVLLPRE